MRFRLLFAALLAATGYGQTSPGPGTPSTAQPPKPASVSGRTMSDSGQVLKKTALTLRPLSPGPGQTMPNPYTTTSDAEGNFSFDAVEPGRYTLSADKAGFQRKAYGSRNSQSGGTILTLTSGQIMSAIQFKLSPQIVISGKILDSDGDPVGQAQVIASRMGFFNGKRQLTPAGFAQTDENGEYKLQSLGPGKYYLSASPVNEHMFGQGSRSASSPLPAGQPAKQEEAHVSTYYPGAIETSSAQVIELTAGHDRSGSNIALRKVPVFHVRGKVSGPLPNDKANLRITVMPRSSTFFGFGQNAMTQIGKDGSFDLSPIPAGSYNLSAAVVMGRFSTVALLPIEVANRNLDDVVLTAESPYDVPGQVTTEKNSDTAPTDPKDPKSTAAPIRLNLQPQDGQLINTPMASTADDGTFTLSSVLPGKYRVTVNSIPQGSYLKGIRYGDQDVLASGLNLTPGGGATRVEITLGANAAKVEGIVQDAEGKPLTSATVTLLPDPSTPERTDLYHQANTDQNGKFTISNVAPGKYRLFAWQDFEYGNQFDADFMKNFDTKGTKLEIAASGSEQLTVQAIKQ